MANVREAHDLFVASRMPTLQANAQTESCAQPETAEMQSHAKTVAQPMATARAGLQVAYLQARALVLANVRMVPLLKPDTRQTTSTAFTKAKAPAKPRTNGAAVTGKPVTAERVLQKRRHGEMGQRMRGSCCR